MDTIPIEILLDLLKIFYEEKMPFNKYLGLKIDSITTDGVVVRIDMRIDYIRPGKGSHFLATGHILRLGNKVAVTRTEFINDEGILIAVGTSTYMV